MRDSSTLFATCFWCVRRPSTRMPSHPHPHVRHECDCHDMITVCALAYVCSPQIYGVFFSFAFITAVALLSWARAGMVSAGRDARIRQQQTRQEEIDRRKTLALVPSDRVSIARIRVGEFDSESSADERTIPYYGHLLILLCAISHNAH